MVFNTCKRKNANTLKQKLYALGNFDNNVHILFEGYNCKYRIQLHKQDNNNKLCPPLSMC